MPSSVRKDAPFPASRAQQISFDRFEVDLRSGELRKNGNRVRLQEQPFQLLAILLEHPGEVVTREEACRKLWPDDTFVDFDHSLATAVNKIRDALGDSAENPNYIETLPKRGYRFIGKTAPKAPVVIAVADAAPEPVSRALGAAKPAGRWKILVPIAGLLVLGLGAGSWLLFSRKAHALTEKDTIVLADLTNTTGDAVFDGTLRQGLSVQLEQSPFLSIISDGQIQQTLQMMGRPADSELTPEIAREVCKRTGSAAVIVGSIGQIGTRYLLTLKAVNCSSGRSLASTEAQVGDKNHVLDALGKTTSEIRNKLGESLNTLQRFDIPLEQATTPSLEALQAYTLGRKAREERADPRAAASLFERATRLDPKFAIAYAALGRTYFNLGDRELAAGYSTKAYGLRDRVSERERLFIESAYYYLVLNNLAKAQQADELWAATYPRDDSPIRNLGAIYSNLGLHEKALEKSHECLRLDPGSALNHSNLVDALLNVNRLEEARSAAKEALAKNLDSAFLRIYLYQISFLQNDSPGMAAQVAWGVGKAGVERVFWDLEASTAAYYGQLGKARELARRAVASAEQADEEEAIAKVEVNSALREALFGNREQGRKEAAAARALPRGRSQFSKAFVLAMTGDTTWPQKIAQEFGNRSPDGTLIQFVALPTLRALLALNENEAQKAVELLQVAVPYESGDAYSLYPVYVHGQAYLAAHQGSEAAVEFQKILDHAGVVGNESIGALAHLGLARAYAVQPQSAQGADAEAARAKARAAYNDFLTLWKDADPDIPILKQAKAEYAKLQ